MKGRLMSGYSNIVYWLGDSLYLNITNRCSSSCYFCFRHYWNGIAGFKLKLKNEPEIEQIIEELKKHLSRRKWGEVVFCGFGEPTMRLDCILEVSRWIKKYYTLKVRLDTNGHGYLLNPGRDVVKELKMSGVDAVSVSLNGHDKGTYNKICRPTFTDAYESALKFIQQSIGERLEVNVTTVKMPEIDVPKIQHMASKLNVRFRARDYIPCFY